MIYLSQFIFPSVGAEEQFLHHIKETCFTTFYPFQILPEHEIHVLKLHRRFRPILWMPVCYRNALPVSAVHETCKDI